MDRTVAEPLAVEPAATVVATARRWLVTCTLMLLVITGYFDRISVAVLFSNSDFQDAMGMRFEPARLGLLMTAFFVTYGLSSALLGFTGDRLGPRRMLLFGSAIWGALMIAMSGVRSYTSMLSCRIALGLFEGPQFGWISRIISNWFPVEERGRGNSVWLLGSPLGSAIGFPLIVFLVAAYGWRTAFLLLGILSIAVMTPLLWLVVKDGPGDRVASSGDATTGVALGRIWLDCRTVLRRADFWFLTVFDCGELIYLWGLNSWLPTYLQKSKHFDVQHLGLYSSLPFVLLLVGEVLSGILADRMSRKAVLLLVGLAGASVLLYGATQVSSQTSAALLIAASSGCFGLCVPATYVIAFKVIPSGATSSGIGVMNGVANMVGAFAPFVMGLVIARTGSIDAGLYVIVAGGLLCSLAVVPLLRLR